MRLHREGDLTPAGFTADVLHNPVNRQILQRLPALGLPDVWLVAGCLFQTLWNLRGGSAPASGIKDYDIFYFDADDLSEQAEARVGRAAAAAFADLGVAIEVKNQARVHTWYPQWFGHPYPALQSARDGIDRFLVPCTSVGLQPPSDPLAMPLLYAPHGLGDLYAGILRPNPLCDHRDLFRAKARSYQARWPWLCIVEEPAPFSAPAD